MRVRKKFWNVFKNKPFIKEYNYIAMIRRINALKEEESRNCDD